MRTGLYLSLAPTVRHALHRQLRRSVFPSNVTKSTTYRSIECWWGNFHRANRRLRSACQSFASALVCDERSFRALALNLSNSSPPPQQPPPPPPGAPPPAAT